MRSGPFQDKNGRWHGPDGRFIKVAASIAAAEKPGGRKQKTGKAGTLSGVASKVAARREDRLEETFAAGAKTNRAKPAAPTATARHPATAEGLRSAYADSARAEGRDPNNAPPVSIMDLRKRIGGTRAEQDALLREAHRGGQFQLDGNPFPGERRSERHAAVSLGGEDMHVISLQRNADGSPVHRFDGGSQHPAMPDGPSIDELTAEIRDNWHERASGIHIPSVRARLREELARTEREAREKFGDDPAGWPVEARRIVAKNRVWVELVEMSERQDGDERSAEAPKAAPRPKRGSVTKASAGDRTAQQELDAAIVRYEEDYGPDRSEWPGSARATVIALEARGAKAPKAKTRRKTAAERRAEFAAAMDEAADRPAVDAVEAALHSRKAVFGSTDSPFGSRQHPPTPEGVTAAIRELNAEPGEWVSITELRTKLAGSRERQDAALRELAVSRAVKVIPEENQKTLTQADRDAAFEIGGEPKHVIQIPRSSPLAPARRGSLSRAASRLAAGSPSDAQVQQGIGDAYARLGGRTGSLITLAELRAELGEVDRETLDRILKQMDRARLIQLESDPNRKALTRQMRDAALALGGDSKHYIRFL